MVQDCSDHKFNVLGEEALLSSAAGKSSFAHPRSVTLIHRCIQLGRPRFSVYSVYEAQASSKEAFIAAHSVFNRTGPVIGSCTSRSSLRAHIVSSQDHQRHLLWLVVLQCLAMIPGLVTNAMANKTCGSRCARAVLSNHEINLVSSQYKLYHLSALQVGTSREYEPTEQDVGYYLVCRVVPFDSLLNCWESRAVRSVCTGPVRPMPCYPCSPGDASMCHAQ